MENTTKFPEIQYFIERLSPSELQLYNVEKTGFTDNSLLSQHLIVNKVLEQTENPSNILLFIIGKILYNLVEYEKIQNLLIRYKSPYIRVWLGWSEFKKGNFSQAESHLTKTVFENDPLLKIESKFALARVADRRGNRKDAEALFKQAFTQLDETKDTELKEIFLDTKFRGVYGKLWFQRTERNVDEMIDETNKVLKDAELYGDRIHLADLHLLLGILQKYLGKWNNAKEYFEISRNIYRDLNNLRGEVIVLSNYSDVERMEGKLDNALGRLLSIISFYKQWDDKRSLAIVHSELGEIYAQKRQFKTAIDEFTKSKLILKEIDAIDEQVNFALAELLIEQRDWEGFNNIMAEILQQRTEDEVENNPTLMFLYGKKEIQKLNLSKAKKYMRIALKLAGEKSLDHLGAKILIVSLQIVLYNYISHPDEHSLNEANKFIEDLKLFIEETQKDSVFLKLINEIEKYNNTIAREKEKVTQRKHVLEMQKAIQELADLIRYSTTQGKETALILPHQIVILHRSGIPIKRYIKTEKIVDDILLFGGMVRAAQDIVTEVFTKETGRMMKIDYGEDIIILAEFGDKDTGIVVITSKDTFHQRRSLHEAVKELNSLILPQQFYGEIENKKELQIDEIIKKWFGASYQGEEE